MSNKLTPVPNPTKPFWLTAPDALATHRSTPDLPETCDVLIIGAGYAGAATAYHLLQGIDQSSSPPSVVILEAREACSGATARNGGHVRPSLWGNITKHLKHGGAVATEIPAFELSHLQAIKDVVEREKIDCDLTITKSFDIFLDQEQAEEMKTTYDKLVADGQYETVKEVECILGPKAEEITGVKGAKACFRFPAAHIWPYKFVLHLLSTAVSKGANLQTNTPVTSVSPTPDSDGLWTISTSRGDIKTKKLVLASNGYTSGIAPQYDNKIIPVRGIVSRIVTPAGKPAPRFEDTHGIYLKTGIFDAYLIPRADGSLIVGGARGDHKHALNEWYDNFDDSKLLETSKNYFDGYMQRRYNGWEESGAHVDSVWTGIMGYSSDGVPHVGEVPGKPGQYIIAGFHGHGMPVIFLTAKAVAGMLGGLSYEEAAKEVKLPRLFKTTQGRLDDPKNVVLENYRESIDSRS